MNYNNPQIAAAAASLKQQFEDGAAATELMKSSLLKSLFDELKMLPAAERAAYGKELNALRGELQQLIRDSQLSKTDSVTPIDITAPFDVNISPADRVSGLESAQGSMHPLTKELEEVLAIFYGMGFSAHESREIDDDYHMFGSLNFPEGHPARDDFDTFTTFQTDADGKPFVAPAHTSTMQQRILIAGRELLEQGMPIAAVIPGRVFRNEDLDARHEHTFYQLEGVYVDQGVHVGHLIATLKTFLQTYYRTQLEVRTQPFYFPFTEPSFEFTLSCPFCYKKGCQICSYSGWIELLGCGMIHPNVLREANIDTERFSGFAFGSGIERLVMMKYNIEDIRHFESGRLDFLRQFA